MKTKKAYEDLARDLEKHRELISQDRDLSCLGRVKDKIFTIDLIENYGWKIPEHITGNNNWFRISTELSAGTFGGDTERNISWEDEGLDPKGEFLLCVCFCTGAYFFGEDYAAEFFKDFFLALQSYDPSFVDSTNKALYFSKENAGKLMQDYDVIVKKYRELYRSESNKRKAAKLREELEKLESQ